MVTVMDSQSKRTIFQDKQAHRSAPCSDISWTNGSRDTLVTVGYDCMMNVYDMRTRSATSCIKNPHPFSTVATSSCGTYCVAGNLKGDIFSYDFRNFKSALTSNRAHDGIVVRVGFIPTTDGKNKSETSVAASEMSTEITTGTGLASPNKDAHRRRDSFDEFLNMCPMRRATMNRRDSFLDMDVGPIKTQHTFDSSCESRNSIALSTSEISDLKLLPKQATDKYDAIIDEESNGKIVIDSPIVTRENIGSMPQHALGNNEFRLVSSKSERKFSLNQRRSTELENLSKRDEKLRSSVLKETIQHKVIIEEHKLLPDEDKPSSHSAGKENENVAIGSDVDNFSKFLVTHNKRSSTPYQEKNENGVKNLPKGGCASTTQMHSIETTLTNRMDGLEEKILKYITDNQREMLFNMWIMEDTSIRDIKKIVDVIIRRDEYLQDYLSTKEENEKLKQEIAELRKKFS